MNGQEKITARHLERTAIIYVRQSTLAQVRDHRGSTERQYEQKTLAAELGWVKERIEVIDEDLGKSGTTSGGRNGFQDLVSQVAMRKCGAVFGVEVSRLSRSNADWYRLLDLCAANDTLVIDDGRVHDPAAYDDRLLLGLKGTMADSEIHMMRSRLEGGRYRKVLRGQFRSGHAAAGYVFAPDHRLIKDPDERVCHAVQHFFKRYEELGSVAAVVREHSQRGLKFPMRCWRLQESHHIDWKPLQYGHACCMLRNPLYAGAFCYGRKSRSRPRWAGNGPWPVLMKGVIEPYITWEQFTQNQRRARENRSVSTTSGVPRRGHALLQGIVFCGKCGRRMGVSYQDDGGQRVYYHCRVEQEDGLARYCFSVTGKPIDKAVAGRLLEVLNRENTERALEIAREVEKNHGEEEKNWKLMIEGAEYEAQRFFRQYNVVEPENRLVARTLERAWNEKLEDLERLKEEYAQWRRQNPSPLTGTEQKRFLDLLEDFEQVWESPTTKQEERKALLRLFVKDVTLKREEKEVTIGIHWRSGMAESLRVSIARRLSAPTAVIEKIRLLSKNHIDSEIAERLNAEGHRTERSRRFTAGVVRSLRRRHAIKKDHKGEPDYYTPPALADLLGVSDTTVVKWCEERKLTAERQGQSCTYWIKLTPAQITALKNSTHTTHHFRH
jgi:DNA invertase Pin-like site-specific DNA recombinase